jgi:hypothetical protein
MQLDRQIFPVSGCCGMPYYVFTKKAYKDVNECEKIPFITMETC